MIGNMYEIIQQHNNYKRECSVYKLGLNNHRNEPYKEITHEMFNKLFQQRDQYKTERDTLIDDLSWYKAKVSRLEQIRDIKDSALKGADIKIKALERENKDLRLQSDTYFEQWQQHKALNNEFSQHIGNKPSSSRYKYFRAKLDNLNITEDK